MKFVFVTMIVAAIIVAGESDQMIQGSIKKDQISNGNVQVRQMGGQNRDGPESADQNVMIFHEDQWQHQKIKIIESTYTYQQEIDPENTKQYSIVYSLIYPGKAEPNRFASSVSKNSFVKQITQKDSSSIKASSKQQNPQKITEQTTKTQKTIAQKQKEAHDIATQYVDKQAKASQKQSFKTPPIKIIDNSLKYLPELNQGQQSYSVVHRDIYPQKSQQNKFALKVTSDKFVKKIGESSKKSEEQDKIEKTLEILKLKQNDEKKAQNILKTEDIEQKSQKQEDKAQPKQSIGTSGKEIFEISPQSPQYPVIQNQNKKIQFKQHDFRTPKKIISYPFETQTQLGESKQSAKSALAGQTKQKQAVPAQKTVDKKVDDKIVIAPIKPQGPQQAQPVKQRQQLPQPSQQKKVKIDESVPDHPQQQFIPKEKPSNPQFQAQSSIDIEALEQNIVQEYQKLKKRLQINSQQLKNHLTYEATVRSQIVDYDWNLFLTKLFVVSTILLAVLKTAFCGAQTKEKPSINTLRYAPVGNDFELQEEDFYQSKPMAFSS